MKYALITPARNEQKFIELTIKSVIAQTLLPVRWIIVDDGSTDDTVAIVEQYAAKTPWIVVARRQKSAKRTFAAKVHAFNTGLERLEGESYDVIGNLDADISFDPDYMAYLMTQFQRDPRLGVAGTPFIENGYDSARDSFEGENHVAGGCQLFRRCCFEDIGGYVPNAAGGVDWIAVTTARMKGWITRSFLEKRFTHYRSLGTAERGKLAALYSYGEKDYYLGGGPLWEAFRVAYRLTKRPIVAGSIALLLGYCSAFVRRVQRPVSPELMRFHRREQMTKLKRIVAQLALFRRVNNFTLEGEKSKVNASR